MWSVEIIQNRLNFLPFCINKMTYWQWDRPINDFDEIRCWNVISIYASTYSHSCSLFNVCRCRHHNHHHRLSILFTGLKNFLCWFKLFVWNVVLVCRKLNCLWYLRARCSRFDSVCFKSITWCECFFSLCLSLVSWRWTEAILSYYFVVVIVCMEWNLKSSQTHTHTQIHNAEVDRKRENVFQT